MIGDCRACAQPLHRTFIDLGMSPLANSFVVPGQLSESETFYPLRVYVCEHCGLVQLGEFEQSEKIFSAEYAYYSSYSSSWLVHAEHYAEAMMARLRLDASSLVCEVGSNDGYLLRHFVAKGISVIGVDPAENCARIASKIGVPVEVRFFGASSATDIVARYGRADLMTANNVLGHVPKLRDFLTGFKIMLKPEGVITFEFPHLLTLIANNEFDTIYHEHLSYLALGPLIRVLDQQDMRVFDVEELPTHGGSLRVYVCHDDASHAETTAVAKLIEEERAARLDDPKTYANFTARVISIKENVMKFLIKARREGRRVAGYGAPAKGNTFLNYCGIGPELIAFTVDQNPVKQNMLLPGSRIPVHAVDMIEHVKPDYVFILPWNLRDEVVKQNITVRSWGGKFVTAIPSFNVF